MNPSRLTASSRTTTARLRGIGDRLFNPLFERIVAARVLDLHPVQKKGRGGVQPEPNPGAAVGLDRLPDLVRIEVGFKPGRVEPDLPGVAEEERTGPSHPGGPLLLLSENQVVHLPEPALLSGRFGRLGGQSRVGVKLQREVAVDDPEPAAEFGAQRFEEKEVGAAGGALEIAVFDQRRPGLRISFDPVVFRNLDEGRLRATRGAARRGRREPDDADHQRREAGDHRHPKGFGAGPPPPARLSGGLRFFLLSLVGHDLSSRLQARFRTDRSQLQSDYNAVFLFERRGRRKHPFWGVVENAKCFYTKDRYLERKG